MAKKSGKNKNKTTAAGAKKHQPQIKTNINKIKKDANVFKLSNSKSKKLQQKAKVVPVKLKNVGLSFQYW